jgi:hypothetical protein
LRRSENRVLRTINTPNREEEARGWRKLHNEELHNLYASPNIITVIKPRMRWVGHVTRMGKILVERPEGERPLGRCRCRLEHNIKMNLREKWWEGVELFHLAQYRDQWRALVNTVMNIRVT